MRTSLAGTLLSSLLIATALTPAGAADVTFERALNSDKEPQNWILHHGNYQGHRFSGLKEINADNAKNLKMAFSVALGGQRRRGDGDKGSKQDGNSEHICPRGLSRCRSC